MLDLMATTAERFNIGAIVVRHVSVAVMQDEVLHGLTSFT